MNPYYGYQLYQAQRTKTRAEILTGDAQLGRQAAAVFRGSRALNSTYQWLDLTARGRQEDWEQPPGRSDSPLMSWLRHHDSYGA